MKVAMADGEFRHVYGNGGLRKALALALCIQKGKLELMMMMMMMIDLDLNFGLDNTWLKGTNVKASRCALPV